MPHTTASSRLKKPTSTAVVITPSIRKTPLCPATQVNSTNAGEGTLLGLMLAQQHTYELLQISPEVTLGAVAAIEAKDHFEAWKAQAKLFGVRQGSMRMLHSIADFSLKLAIVRNTLQLIAGSSSNFSYQCQHLLVATRRCQAFVRKALARRRRDREFVLARWVTQQTRARKVVEQVVKERVKRLRSAQAQSLVEDTWSVLMDCYASPEDMNAAINTYYAVGKSKYIQQLRHYRDSLTAAAATSSNDSPRMRRRRIRERMAAFPARCQVMNMCPSVAELCTFLEYVQASEVARRSASERGTQVIATSIPLPDLANIISPASYYHVLITFNPRTEFPLMLALRALSSSRVGPVPRITGPARDALPEAMQLKKRWCEAQGAKYVVSLRGTGDDGDRTGKLSPDGARRLDASGTPMACVNSGPHAPTSPLPQQPHRRRPQTACSSRNQRTPMRRIQSALIVQGLPPRTPRGPSAGAPRRIADLLEEPLMTHTCSSNSSNCVVSGEVAAFSPTPMSAHAPPHATGTHATAAGAPADGLRPRTAAPGRRHLWEEAYASHLAKVVGHRCRSKSSMTPVRMRGRMPTVSHNNLPFI